MISIAAGISCASLDNWLGEPAVVRCMPNTPALLRQGCQRLVRQRPSERRTAQQAQEVLSAVGLALWLNEEQQLDAVTAVSGTGPAYFFLLIEAMTAAGVKLGLPARHRRTAEPPNRSGRGTHGQCPATSTPPNCVVVSPRRTGTTEAAIKSFQTGGFEALVQQALSAAAHRSAEMAEQLAAPLNKEAIMLGLNDAAIFMIQTLGSLYLLIVLLRFILQLVRADFYNPLCQFVVRPLNRC